MCTRTDHDGACETCQSTDEWVDLLTVPTPTLKPGDRVAVHCGDDTYTFTVPRSDQEPDMTDQTTSAKLDSIYDEQVEQTATLHAIRDLLAMSGSKPAAYDPDLAARNLDAIKHELETPVGEHGECCDPGEVTEDQPIVTRIVDRDGDVWERRGEGWSLWHSSEWGPWRGQGRWPQPPGNGILRPATPADLARVGIEDEPAPADDLPGEPDEALARMLWEIDDPDPTYGWDRARADGVYQRMARAAREHLNPDGIDWESTLSGVVQDRDAAIDRAERAEAERDEALARCERVSQRADSMEAERDDWRAKHDIALANQEAADEALGEELARSQALEAKHAALRAAVQVTLAHAEPDSWADLRLRRILDRDDARDPQAD